MSAFKYVAGGDCERVLAGFIAEPVNAVSSLAYIVVGALIIQRVRRSGGQFALLRLAVALATISVGIGSVAYHGPGGPISKLIHDGAVVALGLAVAIRHLYVRKLSLAVVGLTALAVGVYMLSRTNGALCLPDSLLQGHALWHVLTALVIIVDDRVMEQFVADKRVDTT